jgi:hypothetical protein
MPNDSFSLSHDAWGRLVLVDTDGRKHVGVEPVRAFPISDPTKWVAICSPEGKEVVCIEDLAGLPEEVRRILEEELARREFVPVIRKITRASSDAAPTEWEVVTDRGPTRFTLDSDDHVRRLGPHRVLITDSRGLRYAIPDTRALDVSSRRILDRHL